MEGHVYAHSGGLFDLHVVGPKRLARHATRGLELTVRPAKMRVVK